jgi:hypothetical protein
MTPDGPDPHGAPGGPFGKEQAPAPGELHIKGRRSWKTWQLVIAVLLALGVGMALNYNSSSAKASTGSASGGGYKLPPASGAGATTTAPTNEHGGNTAVRGGSASTTTTAAGSGTTTSTSTPATSTPVTGVTQILIPATQSQGNWTSTPFTVAGGTWNIGWAYRCTPPPASGAALQIFVVGPDGKPAATPAVTQTGPQGQSITPQTTAGQQRIEVESPPGCIWAVKVTGIP